MRGGPGLSIYRGKAAGGGWIQLYNNAGWGVTLELSTRNNRLWTISIVYFYSPGKLSWCVLAWKPLWTNCGMSEVNVLLGVTALQREIWSNKKYWGLQLRISTLYNVLLLKISQPIRSTNTKSSTINRKSKMEEVTEQILPHPLPWPD